VYGNIRGGCSWRGPHMRVGLSTTAIFGNLSGYFFRIFRDKASNIIWRYAAPCQPLTDCKMHDLEWLFDIKIRFSTSTSWIREFECQKLYKLCDSAVFCALHDQLASLGRHAQLTHCFSAVAELLVLCRVKICPISVSLHCFDTAGWTIDKTSSV